MKRCAIALLALWTLVGPPAVGAADEPNKVPQPSKKTPEEQVRELSDAYESAMRDYSRAYSKAATEEERTKASRMRPKADEYAARFLAIADAAPDDPAAVDALLRHVLLTKADSSKAMRRLAEQHAADPRLVLVVRSWLSYTTSPAAEVLFRAIAEKNRDRTARAMAMIALARLLKQKGEGIEMLQERSRSRPRGEGSPTSREHFGQSAINATTSTDPTALSKEVEALLVRVEKEYGDIAYGQSTLGERAAAMLSEVRNLGLGRPCPEIVGEDLDGRSFKLSDYRGKVVLIDFWGDWCAPCRAMYPHGRSLVARMQGKPFALLGVNSDGDKEKLRTRMKEENVTWRYWYDRDTDGPIARQFDIHMWPSFYVLDHRGIIRYKWTDSPGAEALDSAIDDLVARAQADAKPAP